MRWHKYLLLFAMLASCRSAAHAGDPPHDGRNQVQVRGQTLTVYLLRAPANPLQCKILYAPGDGGWRGFGVTIAEELSREGCDVYGLDTRGYLQGFADANLTASDVASDYRTLATWFGQGAAQRVILVGWSEGAGLALAAASGTTNHDVFRGVIAIGATERNILAWRWSDTFAEVRKVLPNEPTFASYDYIGGVSPLPLFMIASSKDEYVSPDMTRRLFNKAGNPKQLVIVDSDDHKYSGKTNEFFATMAKGIAWISQNSR